MTRDTKQRILTAARRAATCLRFSKMHARSSGDVCNHRAVRERRRWRNLLKGIERVALADGMMDVALSAAIYEASGQIVKVKK